MKFRKVCKDSKTNGSVIGTWTKSSSYGNGGRNMRVKSHRRLALESKKVATPKEVDEDSEPNATTDSNTNEAPHNDGIPQMIDIENQVKDGEKQEQEKVPMAPKVQDIQYTVTERHPPGKRVTKHYFNEAMAKVSSDGEAPLDQIELYTAGILSFEEVVLSIVRHEENLALKKMQRKIQRDAPEQVHIAKEARVAVNICHAEAVKAALKSRLERRVLDEQREQMWAQERQAKREENRKARALAAENRRAEEAKLKESQTLKEKQESQKKFLPNQELWREVAYLMTESSKLERESRVWKEAETLLDAREKDIEAREAKKVQEQENEVTAPDAILDAREKGIEAREAKKIQEQENEVTAPDAIMKEKDDEQIEPMDTLHESTRGIIDSTNEIQAALKMVTDLMLDSAKLRKDLYRRYRQDHQFEGYRGVNDPKGLIRILSQDDP